MFMLMVGTEYCIMVYLRSVTKFYGGAVFFSLYQSPKYVIIITWNIYTAFYP